MSFTQGHLDDPQKVGAGERQGTTMLILSESTFENQLKIGRFAKLDTGSIDNVDGSAAPVIAGVVLRSVTNAVEDGGVIDAALFEKVQVIRQGLVTVEVKAGETPALFDRVYVSNAGDANDGMATATNTDIAVNAEFIAEVQSGVWLVYVNPAPGDIATHIGDAVGAHAASAISLLDAAGLTASIEVEAALAEIFPHVAAIIVDPGDAGAIPVARSGNAPLTIGAAAETRTIAIPSFAGQRVTIDADVIGVGSAVVTAASAINQAGNTTMTFGQLADYVALEAVQLGGVLVWRIAANDGVVLG